MSGAVVAEVDDAALDDVELDDASWFEAESCASRFATGVTKRKKSGALKD